MRLLACAALACAGTGAVFAGSANYKFDGDPNEILALSGGAYVNPDNGNPATGGYLSVTDAGNGQRSAIIFDDFDDGLVVKAFSFSMDVRIGGGSGTPADGFSINYVRANDPVLNDPANGWASGWNGEANLPEEGSTTGLAIGFDAYDSGGDGSGNWPQDDVIGISVRLDNVVIAQYRFSTLHGACADATSLQTGPLDPQNPGQPTLLCWQPFSVNLSEDGKLVIRYKNVDVTPAGGLQVNFVPSPGRLVFTARTGDLNQNHHVDNITITTVPSAQPTVGTVTGGPSSFTFDILDAGTTALVNPATVGVTVNGSSVTTTAVKTDATTLVSHERFPALFPAGVTNVIGVSFFDSNGNSNYVVRAYVPGAYEVVPPAFAAAAGTVNTTVRGFKIRTHQSSTGHNNVLALVEQQLAGFRGANQIDAVSYPVGSDGYFTQDFTVINFDRGPALAGSFPNEEQIPGFPGNYVTGSGDAHENANMEVLTYLEFPAAGVYRMGVDSDDGFRVSTSKSAADKLGLVLGQFDGGRGANGTGTQFTFVIQQAGIYPIRLIWMNGGGGSNIEWFSIQPNGTKILVNDSNEASAIKAYRNSTVPAPVPYVNLVNPSRGQTGLPANTPIRADIADGTSLTVNQGSIVMRVNGTALTPTITKSGSITTVSAVPSPFLGSNANNVVTLVFSDNGAPATSYTNTWSFNTASYITLPANIGSAIGSGDATKPGFRIKTWQLDPPGTTKVQNLGAFAEQELLGLFGPNVANLTDFTEGGYFPEPLVVNYKIDANQQGNFGNETFPPGIPGNVTISNPNENYALEIQTYVEFPTAGFYSFGFNSDDGFRTYASEAPGPIHALKINAPAGLAGNIGAVSGGTDEGGIFNPLPTTPITGKVVYANPPLADGPIVNAAELAGNIALVDRGVNGFAAKAAAVKAAGAIAMILVNNRALDNAEGILPTVMGGDRTDFYGVMISIVDGQRIKDQLNAPGGVNASLGADPTTILGQFNGGRGASDTIFNVVVPQAGVYPLRTVTYQGGGGGNCEWFSVLPDGTKVLLNDTATTGHLKTFRARTVAATPTIGIAGSVITYTGTLLSSDTVNGTYTPVAGATSPYTVPNGTTVKFYKSSN